MSFTISPKGVQAAPNAHQIEQQDIRAGRKPSARERALAAAHRDVPQPQAPVPQSALKLTPDPVPQPQAALETPSDNGQLQTPEAPASVAVSPEAAPQASAEAPKPPEQGKEPLSSQYAQLARKERALRAKAVELKQREDALKASQTPNQAPPATANGISLEEFKKNPWKVMQEAGISYDQVTKAALEAPSAEQEVVSQLQAKVDALEAKLAETDGNWKKTWEDSQKTQYNQAITQIKNEVSSLVSNDPEFETIKATNSIQDVVELIEKTFEEDGILLSASDAAKEVEKYLEEEAYKLSQLQKIQKRLKPANTTVSAATAKAPAAQTPTQQQSPKTLTNAMSSSGQLSRYERAMAAAKYGPNWKEKV